MPRYFNIIIDDASGTCAFVELRSKISPKETKEIITKVRQSVEKESDIEVEAVPKMFVVNH